MSLNAQAIAVSGYGFGAQMIAVSGYGSVDVLLDEVVYHGGKGDNPVAYKPTGILHRKKKTAIEERIEIQEEVAQEASSQLARIFEQDTPIIRMSLSEIDNEIRFLMQKEFRNREEESLLVILIAANV